jgi:hypothetical protein
MDPSLFVLFYRSSGLFHNESVFRTFWLLLLLRWGETVSLWNWTSNGPFFYPPYFIRVNMEQRWNYIEKRKVKNSERNLSQCHSVHHKSHMDWRFKELTYSTLTHFGLNAIARLVTARKLSTTQARCALYNHNQLRLSDVGKRAVLGVGERKDECAYREQYPGGSQKHIASYFSLSWGKPTSRRCVRDILGEKREMCYKTGFDCTSCLSISDINLLLQN